MSRARSGVASRRRALVAGTSLLLLAGCGGGPAAGPAAAPASSPPASTGSPTAVPTPSAVPTPTAVPMPSHLPTELPGGGRRIFADGAFLVAYYGTASTGSLGVLGERPPEQTDRRLRRAARAFRRPGHPVQRVYELIVTVVDGSPGPDGDFSHDIPREQVQTWIDAAHRDHALLLLDLQPGRSDFLEVAQRWEWALRDPWVGLALDPEWRMGRRQLPGRVLGSVTSGEVDRTSAWLASLVADRDLPEKLFVLHQFRNSMIRDSADVTPRDGLAEVQHVDGFGTRSQKIATLRSVARPGRFTLGFKLFYDEDVRLMGPRQVFALRPRVRFVSYQ